MSHSRRVSISIPLSPPPIGFQSSLQALIAQAKETNDLQVLCATPAKDVTDGRIFEIDPDVSVDTVCDVLIEQRISCVAVKSPNSSRRYHGLFDCADVNAFLTLAATSHLLSEDDIDMDDRVSRILAAARSSTGKVPIQLCTDLSEKNPLVTLPPSANIMSLLELFSRGTHRAILEDVSEEMHMISDMGLLAWFVKQAPSSQTVSSILSQQLTSLGVGSRVVISCLSSDAVLDAMKVMSEQGMSSVAVVDPETGDLISAVSVTDIARLVAPSQSKKILTMPLAQLIALIKAPDGSQDGVDRYPVFSVSPSATLSRVIQKLVATNSHRIFITDDPSNPSSPPIQRGNLRGVVSVVDVLSVLARLAGVSDVDPTRMQRHRRASSTSSRSSSRSASSSRVSRRPSFPSIAKIPSNAVE